MGTARMQREHVTKLNEFKYWGSTIQNRGVRKRGEEDEECRQDRGPESVMSHAQRAVICDRRVSASVIGNMYSVRG